MSWRQKVGPESRTAGFYRRWMAGRRRLPTRRQVSSVVYSWVQYLTAALRILHT